ncbi:LYR motif containing protein 1-like isoform X2 [Pollicipes pollicipes]|uniref:LYR motif containing protein 1-like isoform X2 n=1 Tax=Pollicipes pollicipes TaxID=41117 RepID=UPI0018858CEB|nr:LYR motif containing protein 1-like isoform X2 [Pollicipes pollicipes]
MSFFAAECPCSARAQHPHSPEVGSPDMSPSPLRGQVLRMYRQILRTARTWEAAEPAQTDEQRLYIRSEAGTLFRRHAGVTDPELVRQYLTEAESRLEMALHYGNPYPRPVNLPPGALAPRDGRPLGRAQRRSRAQSRPVYSRSEDEGSGLDR